ncbi:hypothetical protein [Paenibacillus xerothermodurans]|uniref:Group-specific protein n=1 Tax=Paenibacillus xerothermodurans TaxID=1977292 RepID=A0A2W1N854_PAEXE|nr:hypothetical protein [Paenibacillus xerothermodurans]PZE20034.1 hypothetical protein CBW46_015245 [Paenibacillus xerothermodurans]
MAAANLEEKQATRALHNFIFPFSLKQNCQLDLKQQIQQHGFEFFSLNNLRLEDAYYGDDYRVSHRNMERYYLPFTANILFPHQENADCFQRFSKPMRHDCELKTQLFTIPFRIISVDIFLCPFQLGLITIRTELTAAHTDYSLAVEFANRFRVLEDVNAQDDATYIVCENAEFKEIEEFIFQRLTPFIVPCLDKAGMVGAYFETLPFFVDERMYVQAMYCFENGSSIANHDLYRAAQLDGINSKGEPYISATNTDYIKDYCRTHGYVRWSPDTFYIVNEHSFNCLTSDPDQFSVLANQMYGEYYYGMLLNLFHKIVLLKLSNRYSQIQVEKDHEDVEHLIRSITTFSSKYFFLELVSQSQGREIFMQLRKTYGNDELYLDVKQTLTDLFEYQGQFSAKRQNYLLLILTIYTVIGGIYGMNQVIEDLKGTIDWNKIWEYSIFEWIALFVTFSGMVVAFALGFAVLIRWSKDKLNNT